MNANAYGSTTYKFTNANIAITDMKTNAFVSMTKTIQIVQSVSNEDD